MTNQYNSVNEDPNARSPMFFNDNSISNNIMEVSRSNPLASHLRQYSGYGEDQSPVMLSLMGQNSVRFPQSLFMKQGSVKNRDITDSHQAEVLDEEPQKTSSMSYQFTFQAEELRKHNLQRVSTDSAPHQPSVWDQETPQFEGKNGTITNNPLKSNSHFARRGHQTLRYLTECVAGALRTKDSLTHQEINYHVQLVLSDPSKYTPQSLDKEQLNIKRRVYDALNVMLSVGYISKNQKQLQLSQDLRQSLLKPIKALRNCVQQTRESIEKTRSIVQTKLRVVKQLGKKHSAICELLQKNRTSNNSAALRVPCPVLFVKTTKGEGESNFQCSPSEKQVVISGEWLQCVSEIDLIQFLAPQTCKTLDNK